MPAKSKVVYPEVANKDIWADVKYPMAGEYIAKGNRNKGMIVVFTAYMIGTAVYIPSTGTHTLGEYIINWNMDYFIPVKEGTKIILEF